MVVMATSCRYEFQTQNFGFVDASPEQFYRLQWTGNRWIFLFYRLFVFCYQLGWFVVDFTTNLSENAPGEKPKSLTLSNWSEFVMLVYFCIGSVMAIYAVARKRGNSNMNADVPLSWYHKVNWVFFNIAIGAAFIVTIFYWVVIGRTRTFAENTRPRTVHIHVMNTVLALVDIFMVAFPTRLLHYIYGMAYGTVYGVFLLIMHWTGVDSRVYSVLDWEKAPGVAAMWLCVSVLFMPGVMQAINFGSYHLRSYIARTTVLHSEVNQTGSLETTTAQQGQINQAFEESTPQHKVVELPLR